MLFGFGRANLEIRNCTTSNTKPFDKAQALSRAEGARRMRDGKLKAVFAFILSVVDAGRGKGKNKISFKC